MGENYCPSELEILWNPQTVQVFKVTFGKVTIPVGEVRSIVESHFVCYREGAYEGFNKIACIKELREHFQLLTRTPYEMWDYPTLWLGLREAKEMVDAVYQEGLESGLYRAICPCEVPFPA